MPSPIEIVRLLPFIIRLFPELAQSSVLGKIIPLFDIDPANDPQAEEALATRVKIKPRDDSTKDESQVIKLSEAISCVEEHFNNTSLIWKMILAGAQRLVGQQRGAVTQELADKVVECLRENALRQNSTRTTQPPRQKYHRPAKGHGHGRGNF